MQITAALVAPPILEDLPALEVAMEVLMDFLTLEAPLLHHLVMEVQQHLLAQLSMKNSAALSMNSSAV